MSYADAILAKIEEYLKTWSIRIDQLPDQIPGSRIQPGAPGLPGAVDPDDFLADPTTTAGDIIVRGASALGRLGIGLTGQVPRVSGGTLAYDTLDAGDVGAVPTSRTLTIDGVAYDLSADRTWTTSGGSGLPWFDVTAYGATGDGTTDDTAAVQDAVDAYNVAGGVLYFPGHGTYKTSGGFTLSKPGLVLGDGGAEPNAATWVSAVTCTSATATLFTVAHDGIAFERLHLRNTAASTPSAGSAIHATTGDGLRIEACSFRGFYDLVDAEDGAETYITDTFFYGPVRYALRLRHVDLVDAGDQGVVNCQFIAETYDASAAIRYESGGGLRLTNCKVNGRGSARFGYGLDISIGSGVSTIIMLISNTSIENIDGNSIRLAVASGGSFGYVHVTGCQFGHHENTNTAIAVTNSGTLHNVSVVGCSFLASASTANAAITMSGVDRVALAANTIYNYGARSSLTSCTNVLDLDSGGGGDPSLGGDLSGTASAATVEAVQGQPWATTAPGVGDVATWDGSQWAPAAPTGGGSGEVLLDGDGTVLVGDDDDWLYEG